jgi:hypothetical protein
MPDGAVIGRGQAEPQAAIFGVFHLRGTLQDGIDDDIGILPDPV